MLSLKFDEIGGEYNDLVAVNITLSNGRLKGSAIGCADKTVKHFDLLKKFSKDVTCSISIKRQDKPCVSVVVRELSELIDTKLKNIQIKKDEIKDSELNEGDLPTDYTDLVYNLIRVLVNEEEKLMVGNVVDFAYFNIMVVSRIDSQNTLIIVHGYEDTDFHNDKCKLIEEVYYSSELKIEFTL